MYRSHTKKSKNCRGNLAEMIVPSAERRRDEAAGGSEGQTVSVNAKEGKKKEKGSRGGGEVLPRGQRSGGRRPGRTVAFLPPTPRPPSVSTEQDQCWTVDCSAVLFMVEVAPEATETIDFRRLERARATFAKRAMNPVQLHHSNKRTR